MRLFFIIDLILLWSLTDLNFSCFVGTCVKLLGNSPILGRSIFLIFLYTAYTASRIHVFYTSSLISVYFFIT